MKKAQEWIDMLEGRWAFGILGRNEQDLRILDVVRGYSNLYYMEVKGIGRIFTTDDSDAKDVIRDMKEEFLVKPEQVPANTMYRYNALNGDFLEMVEFTDSTKNYRAPAKTTTEIYYGTSGKWVNGVWKSYTDITPDLPDEALLNSGNGYEVTDPMDNKDYPDVMNASGTEYDYRKVNKYCNDEEGEPFVDRLAIWDDCYSTKIMDNYYLLTDTERAEVERIDFMSGFQDARVLIFKLAKGKAKKA